MLTKKVKKRVSFLSLLLVFLVLGVFFILKSLTSNILYFKSPTDIQLSQDIISSKKIRVGGMVKRNSININNQEIKFIITDLKSQAIINTDSNAYAKYMARKAKQKEKDDEVRKVIRDVNELRNEMREIKNLILGLKDGR